MTLVVSCETSDWKSPWRLAALLRPMHGFSSISLFPKDFDIRFTLLRVVPDQGAPRMEAMNVIYPRFNTISRPLDLPVWKFDTIRRGAMHPIFARAESGGRLSGMHSGSE